MLGGGTPLEMHSRLMRLCRTTACCVVPVVRMDGGTGKGSEDSYFLSRTAGNQEKRKSQKGKEKYLPAAEAFLQLACRV